jgi:hypothetical protein
MYCGELWDTIDMGVDIDTIVDAAFFLGKKWIIFGLQRTACPGSTSSPSIKQAAVFVP